MTDAVSLVETAMVTQLKAVARPYNGLVVESYAAQLDDELFSWIRKLPATWVTFSGMSEYKRLGNHSFKAQAKFEVLVAQRDLGENAGRLNDGTHGQSVGVYTILDDNKRALVNQKLGLAIQPFTPGPVRAVMKGLVNREAIVVYAQEFSTEWMETFEEAPLTPSEPNATLNGIGLSYYLKPQHTPPGDPADKTDLITTT